MIMARSGHVKKMARCGEAQPAPERHHAAMHARYVDGITIRQLRHGDTATVATLFARLGHRSREQRFCGAKPRLARGRARRARTRGRRASRPGRVRRRRSVARRYGPARPRRHDRPRSRSRSPTPTRDAGSARSSAEQLAADARAAGITELVATVCGDNPAVVSLLRAGRGLAARQLAGPRARVRLGLGG